MEIDENLAAGGVRASDNDRESVAEQLRRHSVAGRLGVEDFERRVGLAMSAQTVHELAELLRDLPSRTGAAGRAGSSGTLTQPGAPSTSRAPRLGPPGVRAFVYRLEIPMAVARSRVLALDTIAPALGAMGYALLRPTPDTLEFRRDDRVWVAIDLEPDDQGMTSMTIRGRAPLLVRRRFARLSLS